MDFALLPPEVNSARMYAGPGSQPLVAAAMAWDGLSAELRAAGALYGSVIEELTAGPWRGPASAAMAAGASPYVEWMTATAAQAEQAAIQAKAAAAAYEVAFAATVPPPVIAANRAQFAALVATNIFGQNTAAIAATEASYAQMWAQDAMAMYGYAGVSASATALTPFTPPPQSVNTDGLGAQAAALAHSAAATATSNTQSMLAHVTSAVPAALQGLASPATSTSAAGVPSLLYSLASITPETVVSTTLEVSDVSVGTSGLVTASGAWADASADNDAIHQTAQDWHDNAKNQLRDIMRRFDQLGTVASTDSAGLDYEAPSAQVGEAASVGRLSVPQGWTEAAPAMRLAAAGLPSFSAAPAALAGSAGGAGSLFSELALAGIAGRALSGPLVPGARERAGAAAGDPAASGKRSSRSPGPPGSPGDPSEGIAAEIREFAEVLGRLGELRASGLLTEEEFTEQKQRLLGR